MAEVEVTLDIREVTNYPELTDHADNNKYVEGYSVEMLEIGDFIVDHNVIVEHKSPGDFVDSMKSGHLEDQIARMYMGYNHVHVLVSGDMDDFDSGNPDGVISGGWQGRKRDWGDKSNLEKAVKGFIASLEMRWDVTPMFCSNIENVFTETVNLGRKAKEPMKRTPTGPMATVKDDMDPVETALITLVDGVSTKLAERISPHFDSVGELCEAEEDDFTHIEGIGGKTAKNIKEKLQ